MAGELHSVDDREALPQVPEQQDTGTSRGADAVSRSGEARKAVLWVITAVVSALVGVLVKWWWEAPRPAVELSTVQLRSVETPDAVVQIPLELRARIEDHSYIPNVEERPSVKDVRELINAALASDESVRAAIERTDELMNLIRSRPTTMSVDERRREFLLVWSRGSVSEMLQTEIKYVLGAREDALPAHYRRPRTSPYVEWVQLPGSVVKLVEIDEVERAKAAAQRSGPNAYDNVLRDGRNANMLRRLWAFMEPDVVAPVLQETKERFQRHLAESQGIVEDLEATLQEAQPDRLVATLTVTNRGGRPLALRNLAVLDLLLPSRGGGSSEVVHVDLVGHSSDAVTVVAPGGVEIMQLQSADTASQLVKDHEPLRGTGAKDVVPLSRSRLKALFDAEGVSAKVAVARAGADPEDSLMAVTAARPVGAKGDSLVLSALRARD